MSQRQDIQNLKDNIIDQETPCYSPYIADDIADDIVDDSIIGEHDLFITEEPDEPVLIEEIDIQDEQIDEQIDEEIDEQIHNTDVNRCIHILKSGKNKGSTCGRETYDLTACKLHCNL